MIKLLVRWQGWLFTLFKPNVQGSNPDGSTFCQTDFHFQFIFICAEQTNTQTDQQTNRQTEKHLTINSVAKTFRSARLRQASRQLKLNRRHSNIFKERILVARVSGDSRGGENQPVLFFRFCDTSLTWIQILFSSEIRLSFDNAYFRLPYLFLYNL